MESAKKMKRLLVGVLIICLVWGIPANAMAPRSIIGVDNRRIITNTKSAPYNFIGKIRATYNINGANKTFGGTGVLVSDNIVMTAAHCVYSTVNGHARSITFSPGETGTSKPYKTAKVLKVFVPNKYITNPEPANDYAFLYIDKSFGKTIGRMEVEQMPSKQPASTFTQIYNITGYNGTTLYTHNGYVNYIENSSNLRYKIDTDNGQSGAPIYYGKGGKYYCIGVHTNGGTVENIGHINNADVMFMFVIAKQYEVTMKLTGI